jgi:hypothetical protein
MAGMAWLCHVFGLHLGLLCKVDVERGPGDRQEPSGAQGWAKTLFRIVFEIDTYLQFSNLCQI